MKQKIKDLLLLAFSLSISYGVEWSASIFTRSTVSSWYQELNKPFWSPPDFLFPMVWTLLYTLIGISLWLLIREEKPLRVNSFMAFSVQLFLNFTWSFSFFYLQSISLGLINILLLMSAILWNIFVFSSWSKLAARLLIPYFLWVSYAATLNFGIWWMN